MAYPSTVETYTPKVDGVDHVMAAHVNTLQTAMTAVMTELGTDPAGSAIDLKTRLAASLTAAGALNYTAATTLTIASGTVTATQNYHRVDTEGGAATDDLTTINGITTDGFQLVLHPVNSSRDITIKHGTGNIFCSSGTDIVLSYAYDLVFLIYSTNLSGWIASRGVGGITPAALGAAADNMPFVTIGNTASLSAERALTAGAIITLTDGGANSTATIAVDDTKLSHTSGKLTIGVTAGKTLTLASAGDYTLTVPATGTAALLAVNNAFTGLQTFTSNLSDSSSIQLTATYTQTTTTTGTRNPKNMQLLAKPIIQTGVTDSGSFYAINGLCLRNFSAAGTDDGGSLDTLAALVYQFGHNNTNASATPTTTTVRGVWVQPYARTGTITTLQSIYLDSQVGTSTVTTAYGLYIRNATYLNYIQGKLLLGDTVDDGQWLQVTQTDSAANTVGEIARLSRQTSGTAAAGFGARLLWQLESSTTVNQDSGSIDSVWTTATHATRTADMVFSLVNAATFGEVWRMKASGDLLGIKGGVTAEGGYGFWSVADATLSRGNGVYVNQAGTSGRVDKCPIDGDMCIGIAYADATAGNPVFVVTSGRAFVLPDAAITLARGYVIYSSSTAAGLCQQANTVPAATQHFREWGHVLETGSGNGAGSYCAIHFN